MLQGEGVWKTLTVMAESNKLDVKDARLVFTNTTHADGVALAQVAVETGLWPVVLVKHHDGGLRGRRAAQGLRLRGVLSQRLLDLLGRGRRALLEGEGHAGRVAVQDGDTVAGGGYPQPFLLDESSAAGIDTAQDLPGLRLELVLLALDEGDHVINHIHAAHAGVARAADGLHGHDAHGADLAELSLEGGERDDEADNGAVGVADEEALVEAVDFSLVGDEVEMREVDGGHDEGHEGVAAVVFGVGEDGDVGLDKFHLCIQSS